MVVGAVGGTVGDILNASVLFLKDFTMVKYVSSPYGTRPRAIIIPSTLISLATTTRASIGTIMCVGIAAGDGAGAMTIRSPFTSFFKSFFKFKNNKAREHRVRAPGHRKTNSNIVVSTSNCVIAGGRIIDRTSRLLIGLGSGHRFGKHVVNASRRASLTLVGVRNGSFPALPVNSSSRLGLNR